MTWTALIGALETGLIFGLVGLGVYLSFRVLDFPDLTADGSFALGGAVAATAIVGGWNPYLATVLAILAGAIAGCVTAWLNVQLKILNLLASILTAISLYSINLRVMGRPNVALLGQSTLYSPFKGEGGWIPERYVELLLLLAIAIAAKCAADWFLGTELGLALRATGANPRMARAQGIATGGAILLGMGISNGLIALGGALFAQTFGFADVTMGVGTIVFGFGGCHYWRDFAAWRVSLAGHGRGDRRGDCLSHCGGIGPQSRFHRPAGSRSQFGDGGVGGAGTGAAASAQSV